MTALTVIGLIGGALYTAALVALVAAIAKTPLPGSKREATAATADEEFIAGLTAHLKAYGAEIADLYDTTPGDR